MVFFCVELIRINITNDALQTICEEATFLTSAHNYESGPDLIAKIDAIIEKHRPRFIPAKSPQYTDTPAETIRYSIEYYLDCQAMLSAEPYGGTTATFSNYEQDTWSTYHAQAYAKAQYVPMLGKQYNIHKPNLHAEARQYLQTTGFPEGSAFAMNIVCNYPFSNKLVKILFNKGINTRYGSNATGFSGDASQQQIGTMYLLYTRGAGIVGKKK